MAARHRIFGTEIKLLETVEEAKEKIGQHKLVVILFNQRYLDGNNVNVEHIFNGCRPVYENRFNVYCYKCVDEDDVKDAFSIKVTPAIIFFRDGEETDRLEDADQPFSTAPKEEKNPKDYQLRTYFDKLCNNKTN